MTDITDLINEAKAAIVTFTVTCGDASNHRPDAIVERAADLERALARVRLRHVTHPEEKVRIEVADLAEVDAELVAELNAKLAMSLPQTLPGYTVLHLDPQEDQRHIAARFRDCLHHKKVPIHWDNATQQARVNLYGIVSVLLQSIDPFEEDVQMRR